MRIRFGIASLLLLAALVAIVARLSIDRKPVAISFIDLELESHAAMRAGKYPPSVKRLDNRTVRLRGYISPSSVWKADGIKRFILIRDNMEAEFDDWAYAIVRMTGESKIDFTTRPIDVVGKLSILLPPIKHNNRYYLYEIAAKHAGPIPKKR